MFKPGHYRAAEPVGGPYPLPTGTRVRFLHHDPDADEARRVKVRRGSVTYSFSEHEFRRHFEHLPDGEAVYAQEVADLTREISGAGQELSDLHAQLEGVHLSLNRENGQVGGVQALLDAAGTPAESAGLTLAPTTTSLQQARATALTLATRIRSVRDLAEDKRRQVEALVREAQDAALAMIAPIEAFIGKLKETVWTLELYAGEKEELHQLTQGTPAPANVPITIRQGVLAMDEEAQVMLDKGGMDSQDIAQFDAWVREDPSRLDTFLPEEKGVVALVPRWEGKKYQDSREEAEAKAENAVTHFLIRNGQNIYRVRSDFYAGRHLIPTRTEFLELFEETVYEDGRKVRRPMELGSRAFLAAEKQESARKRHYYRVALILQGLIDRTAVFHPLPVDASGEERPVNLISPDDYEAGRVVVLEDVSTALADPRESFGEWLTRVNAAMEVGRRVIGSFRHSPFTRDFENNYRNARFSPETADPPSGERPLTIEDTRRGDFIVRYERHEEIYKGWDNGFGRPERRASIRVQPTDSTVILMDHPDVTEAAILDFLSRKQERRHYLTMVPTLKNLLTALREEAQAEAPFRQLLTHAAQQAHGVTEDEARALTEQAIPRYKYRLRQHRALIEEGQESEAFRKCLAEVDLLRREGTNRARRRESGEFGRVRDELLARHPEAFLITHRGENEYAAYLPERKRENVYARLVLYRTNRGALRLHETRGWRILDRAHERHEVLHEGARLATWAFFASPSRHITDPELERLHGEIASFAARTWTHTPFAVTFTTWGMAYELYARESGPQARPGRVRLYRVAIQREGGEVQLRSSEQTDLRWEGPGRRPWQRGARVPSGYLVQERREDALVLSLDEATARQCDEEAAAIAAQEARESALLKAVSVRMAPLWDQWRARQWEVEREKFVARYGAQNAHLWTDHKKTVNGDALPRHDQLYQNSRSPVWQALHALLDAGENVDGLTLGDLGARAEALTGQPSKIADELLTLTLPNS